MIGSASVSGAARLSDLWRADGPRRNPELTERELATALRPELVLAGEQAGEITGTPLIPNEPRRSSTVPSPAAGGWRDIEPDLAAEPYVFAAAGQPPPGVDPFAVIREDEGTTLVLTRADADRAGLTYGYVAARITLRVQSGLADVGLTALVSRILAEAAISCNVIAGLAHDHLFVEWDQGARALALLRDL